MVILPVFLLLLAFDGPGIRAAGATDHTYVHGPTVFRESPSAAKAYADAVLADGPWGYWPLSDVPGSSVAADASGNKRHGFYTGHILPVSALFWDAQGQKPAEPSHEDCRAMHWNAPASPRWIRHLASEEEWK